MLSCVVNCRHPHRLAPSHVSASRICIKTRGFNPRICHTYKILRVLTEINRHLRTVTPAFATLPQTAIPNPFPFHTYKKQGGGLGIQTLSFPSGVPSLL